MALAEFIVAFREFFEIALILGIMLAYLRKTGATAYSRYVYAGAGVALLASLGAAYGFERLAGGFEAHEALFEGTVLLISSLLVSWFIVWMLRQQKVSQHIHRHMRLHLDNGQVWGLAAFAFVAVFREGVELVLFLAGIDLSTGALSLAAIAAGIFVGLFLAYLFFAEMAELNLKRFFNVTTVLLVFLAAGLLSQSVHELEEVGLVPAGIPHLYDVTPALNPDGSYPLLHEKGAAGSVLKGLLGYDTSPSLAQAVAYLSYLAIMYLAYVHVEKRSKISHHNHPI